MLYRRRSTGDGPLLLLLGCCVAFRLLARLASARLLRGVPRQSARKPPPHLRRIAVCRLERQLRASISDNNPDSSTAVRAVENVWQTSGKRLLGIMVCWVTLTVACQPSLLEHSSLWLSQACRKPLSPQACCWRRCDGVSRLLVNGHRASSFLPFP